MDRYPNKSITDMWIYLLLICGWRCYRSESSANNVQIRDSFQKITFMTLKVTRLNKSTDKPVNVNVGIWKKKLLSEFGILKLRMCLIKN